MNDQNAGRSPGMLRNDWIGRIKAEDATSDNKTGSFGPPDKTHFDIANAGNRQRLSGKIEPCQRHDHSAGRATSSSYATKERGQRLVKVLFDILACRLRGLFRELPVSQTVNDAGQGVSLPLSKNDCIAILWQHPASAGGGPEFKPTHRKVFD